MTETQRRDIRLATAYVANIAFLRKAEAEGRLADPKAIEAEIMRAVQTLERVLSPTPEGTP